MKILITGHTGFIGRTLCERLTRRQKHHVVGVSADEAPTKADRAYTCDVRDLSDLHRIFAAEAPDLVIHLAAVAHGTIPPSLEERTRSVNVAGAVNVAHAARDNRCRGLIHFSTAKVWGVTTSPEGRSEDAHPSPRETFGKMALAAEQKLLEDFNDGSFPVVVLRPVTVFGRGDEHGGCAKIISALKRGFFPLLDGGGARRSLLYAENLADRVERLIDKGWKGGATYGVSDFNVSLSDFAALVKEHRKFALTPAIPLSLAERLRVLDRYLSPLLPVETPVADAIMRMSTDFVIHTRLFEQDYGYAPRLSLKEAIAATLS